MYVVVCKDLPPHHQAVQAVHAGIDAGRFLVPESCEIPYLVLLTVPSQSDLVKLSVHLGKYGVCHRVFVEDDMGGRPTALSTEPIAKEDTEKRKLFKGLKAYRVSSSENGETRQAERRPAMPGVEGSIPS